MLLPVRGRHAETLNLIPRLEQTAELPYNLIVIVDADSELQDKMQKQYPRLTLLYNPRREGYWRSLRLTAQKTEGEFIATLANDLLPGCGWLRRAMDAHTKTFGNSEGLIGFNDGVHFGEHAAHFLINRSMLKRWYGENYFPVMYDHTFGDSEMCMRAQQEGRFAIANFSIMYHNHPYNGKATDKIYAEGQELTDRDKKLFYRRLYNQWKD